MFTLTLSQQQLQTIGAALGELPYKVAAPLLAELQRQVDEATKAASEKQSSDEPPNERGEGALQDG